jgi:hypothetical protein
MVDGGWILEATAAARSVRDEPARSGSHRRVTPSGADPPPGWPTYVLAAPRRGLLASRHPR